MYQYSEGTARAIDEMGIRGIVCKPEIDIPTVLEFEDFKNPNENEIIKGMACHAVYTVSEDF